ncbi:nucleic acid-binding protein [Guyanagaster necrorhizus]|uniref:Nucleic acid-binding protein n=1 Tax=Guyanagaster necrorhizus TaxID=856835 RepID=A0A9P7VMG2_9AGAR|nr:nucleic acid-binding protein [Guyanagaster necrorhizus MCA 3950]KAG7443025.1 nucleic acid-binding protein [Guyanagaster necrorhizus MCA 3950]
MSFVDSVSKLSGSVKDLVLSASDNSISLLGQTDADKIEVAGWIEKVGQGDLVKEDNFKTLDTQLVPRTYIVNNYLTAADVALYGALHPTFSKLQPTQYYSHPALTRYFDHIQSSSPVRKAADPLSTFPLVTFDFAHAPKIDRTAEPPKKKQKTPSPPTKESAPPAEKPSKGPSPAAEGKPQQKKEKKEKKKDAATQDSGKKKGAENASAADEGEPVPSMIDLRVGHIIDVKKHPDADGLYIEQIDIGEETGPRTVVSGLVHYIPIEEMRDKYLIAVCNLKPANMRGVKSFAMVLAATHKDGKDGGIELIQPPANSKPGDRVYFEGEEFENATALSQLNPKKKIFETIQPGLITLETREAAWVNPDTKKVHRIRTKEGVCIAPTFVGASLS